MLTFHWELQPQSSKATYKGQQLVANLTTVAMLWRVSLIENVAYLLNKANQVLPNQFKEIQYQCAK